MLKKQYVKCVTKISSGTGNPLPENFTMTGFIYHMRTQHPEKHTKFNYPHFLLKGFFLAKLKL